MGEGRRDKSREKWIKVGRLLVKLKTNKQKEWGWGGESTSLMQMIAFINNSY